MEIQKNDGRGGRRTGAGRPKGAANKGTQLGRKTAFVTASIAGSPDEISRLKEKAKQSGKSLSRFILDSLLT